MASQADLTGDARVPYGPASQRPSAQAMGDKALWVDPTAQQPLSQVRGGNWAPLGPAGVPVLYGPYVVDYTDIPHDGDTKPLWTPQVGDVLLRLFSDPATEEHWDSGQVAVGQNPTWPSLGNPTNVFAHGNNPLQGDGQRHVDNIVGATNGATWDNAGHLGYLTAIVFTSTDPVVAMTATGGDPDPAHGHVEIYALVARAVAP